jgi:hypothetical protein
MKKFSKNFTWVEENATYNADILRISISDKWLPHGASQETLLETF